MTKLVALSGSPYSGKTTLARELERRGYVLLNFTDLLKTYAVEAVKPFFPELTVEDIAGDKAYWRPFLQAYGAVIGFDTNPHFVNLSLMDWWKLGANVPAVFDNVRFDEQWEVLQPYGFELFHLSVPWEVQKKRARAAGVDGWTLRRILKHEAENGLSVPAVHLDGTMPVSELADLVERGRLSEMVIPFGPVALAG